MSSMPMAMQDGGQNHFKRPPSMLGNPIGQQAGQGVFKLSDNPRKLLSSKNVARKGLSSSRASAWKAKHSNTAAEATASNISNFPTSLPSTGNNTLFRPLNQTDRGLERRPDLAQKQTHAFKSGETSVLPTPLQEYKNTQASFAPSWNNGVEQSHYLHEWKIANFPQAPPAQEQPVKIASSSKRRRDERIEPPLETSHQYFGSGNASSMRNLQGLHSLPSIHNLLNPEAMSAQPPPQQAGHPSNRTNVNPPQHRSAWLEAWRERESPRHVLPKILGKRPTPVAHKPRTITRRFIDLTHSDNDDDDFETSASSRQVSERSSIQPLDEEPLASSKTSSATPCPNMGQNNDLLKEGQIQYTWVDDLYDKKPRADLGQKPGLQDCQGDAPTPVSSAADEAALGDLPRPETALQPQMNQANHPMVVVEVPQPIQDSISPESQSNNVAARPALTREERRRALRFNTFSRKNEVTLEQAIYGIANAPNRPGSSSWDRHVYYQSPIVPTPATRYAHLDPRIHWTWKRSPEWYEKKMAEVSTRGNKKSPSRFGKGKASLQRRLEKEKQTPRQEFPDKVLQNPEWLAAARALKQMAAIAAKKKGIIPLQPEDMEFAFVGGRDAS